MKLDYKLNAEDFVFFNWYIHWSRPSKKVFRVLFHAAPFILVGTIIVVNQFDEPQIGRKEILLLIPALVFSWFGPKYMQWRIARTIRKKVEAGGYATQLTDRELHLGESTVRLVSGDGDNEVDWEKFIHWHEFRGYIFMFLDRDQAIMIPKRAMDDSQLEQFTGLLNKYIGE